MELTGLHATHKRIENKANGMLRGLMGIPQVLGGAAFRIIHFMDHRV